jgi:hypothetical protein
MKSFNYGSLGRRGGTAGPQKPGRSARTYYLDYSAGDDANDGLTVGNPIKTFDHFWNNILPDVVTQQYTLNMAAGTVNMESGPNAGVFDGKQFDGGYVNIKGDESAFDFTGSGGPITPSSGGYWTATFSPSPAWTTNEHAGKVFRDQSTDVFRYVAANTADTLYFESEFPFPTSGRTMEFCSYLTTLLGYTRFKVDGVDGRLDLRSFNITNSDYLVLDGPVHFYLYRVRSNGYLTVNGQSRGVGGTYLSIWYSAFYGLRDILIYSAKVTWFRCLFRSDVEVRHGDFYCYDAKTYIDGSLLLDSCSSYEIEGLGELVIDGTGRSYALDIRNCPRLRLYNYGVMTLKNASVAGMRVQSSHVIINESFDGTNTSYGMVIRQGSHVRVKSGETPTCSGGTANVYNGSATSTWAAITGGTALTNAAEQSSVVVDNISEDDD